MYRGWIENNIPFEILSGNVGPWLFSLGLASWSPPYKVSDTVAKRVKYRSTGNIFWQELVVKALLEFRNSLRYMEDASGGLNGVAPKFHIRAVVD